MSREHGGPAGRIGPAALIYIAGFGVGVALEYVFPIGALPLALAVIAGVTGAAIGLALDGAAMLLFTRAGTSMVPAKPTTALITSGPYRFTRNPMYVGMAFLYAGLALAFGVIWALALLPLVLLVVDGLVIPPEERPARFQLPRRVPRVQAPRPEMAVTAAPG